MAFTLAHPSYYRLMHSPAVRTPPAAAAEAYRLVLEALERCAAAGRPGVSPQAAAQALMAAGTGVALMLVTGPGPAPTPIPVFRVVSGTPSTPGSCSPGSPPGTGSVEAAVTTSGPAPGRPPRDWTRCSTVRRRPR